MSVAKLFAINTDGSFKLEATSGTTPTYRWIKLPPLKEGYEIVRVQEVEDLLDRPVGDKALLVPDAIVHVAGLILVKEKEHA